MYRECIPDTLLDTYLQYFVTVSVQHPSRSFLNRKFEVESEKSALACNILRMHDVVTAFNTSLKAS